MDIVEAILQLPDQCEQAWDEASKIVVPEDWKNNVDDFGEGQEKRPIRNIIVCGMGGSALGAHVIQSNGALNVPITINNNYLIPKGFGKDTLVVLASYSGGTEEVLSCAKDAKDKGYKIIGVTSGGKLGDFLKENNYPAYIFDPKYNGTKQPRMGVGYTMIGMIALFDKLGLFSGGYTDDIVEGAIQALRDNVDLIQKLAQEHAPKLKDKFPVIFASDYLVGNAHIFANQFNETAKSFSAYYAIPEANHHFLEGLKHPSNPATAIFLGEHYSERIIKRLEITKEILEKNNWEVLWYRPQKDEPFAQSLEVLLFSSLTTAYLGIEYGEDPLAIPTVDYFKEKLG
jgi:glucose/mannose-6-phosphate isomerase